MSFIEERKKSMDKKAFEAKYCIIEAKNFEDKKS